MGRPRTPAGRARWVDHQLEALYPGSAAQLCALEYTSPYELLAATILSAQCTDVRVNLVTPALFAAYPTPCALGEALQDDVERLVRSTGFYRAKATNLIGMGQAVCERFGGEVPWRLTDLVTLPGVGRKTGNVLRSVAFELPGLPVDTHVGRLALRLGLTTSDNPVTVERELNAVIPAGRRGAFSLRMILHGRATCVARRPRCLGCALAEVCPKIGANPA